MLEAKMLINGELVGASDGAVLESTNPYNNEVIGTYPAATREDIDNVLDAAQGCKKVWASMSFNDRAAILLKAADLIEEHADEMGPLVTKEMAKPINDSTDEYLQTAEIFRSCVAIGSNMEGSVIPDKTAEGSLGNIVFTTREPLGVVLCIGPFNFPLSTLAFKIAPALACGNVIIIKAPSAVALSVLRFAEIINEAGFPKGVIQAVSGPGSVTGDYLLDTPKINAIGMTGSTSLGVHIQEVVGKYFTRLLLELGGNDPLLITADADLDYAVEQSMARSVNSGQVCCGPKRFIVDNKIKDEYIRKLIESFKNLKFGDSMDPETNMACLVSETAAKKIELQIQHAIDQGAKLIHGGKRIGAFIEPTVIDSSRNTDVARDEEVFGPLWTVIGYDTEEEAIDIANQTCYGLNGGVISGDVLKGINLAAKIESGTVAANGHGLFRLPEHQFGGYKHSGIGRESLKNMMDEYSQVKTIVVYNK